MPLSRGTAAVGYMTLIALFLSVGVEVVEDCTPLGIQVDWEGILRPTSKDFIETISKWLYPTRKPTNILDNMPSIAETFPTLRSMIEILNA